MLSALFFHKTLMSVFLSEKQKEFALGALHNGGGGAMPKQIGLQRVSPCALKASSSLPL